MNYFYYKYAKTKKPGELTPGLKYKNNS